MKRAAAILSLLALPASGAWAQPVPVTTSPSLGGSDVFALFDGIGDAYSSVFLNQIFGDLFPTSAGTSLGTVLPDLIGFFNLVILAIGGAIFFWNITVGVLQTAHEGQVLGARWSSLWAPIRTVAAVGMLVPLDSGYNLGQSGVAWVVQGGTRMASMVWNISAESILGDDQALVAVTTSFPEDMTRNLYMQAVCAVITERQMRIAAREPLDSNQVGVVWRMQNTPVYVRGVEVGTFQRSIDDPITYLSFQRLHDRTYGPGVCGSRKTPGTPEYISNVLERSVDRMTDPDGPEVIREETGPYANLMNEFHDGHTRIMDELYDSLKALVQAMYEVVEAQGPLPNAASIDQFRNGIKTFHGNAFNRHQELVTRIREQASALEGNPKKRLLERIQGRGNCGGGGTNTNLGQSCDGEGWMMAGAYYVFIARANNVSSGLSSAFGKVTPPESFMADLASGWIDFGDKSHFEAEFAKMSANYEMLYDRAVLGLASEGFSIPKSLLVDANRESRGIGEGDPTDRITHFLDANLTSVMSGALDLLDPRHDGMDPMVGMMWWGNFLMGVGATIMGAAALSSISVLGVTLGPGLAIGLLPFFSVLIAAGAGLSFILPLMPFLFWILAVMGYFLLICEAIIAVSLWALSHLRMDGEGISGEAGRQGWLMILSLFMTPTLMILGFLIGMILFRVVTSLISLGMLPVVSAIIGGNPILFFFGLCAYSVTMFAVYALVLERSFSLISEFPNRVMKWMGSSVDIMGGEDRIRMAAGAGAVAMNQGGNVLEAGVSKLPKVRLFPRKSDGEVKDGS